jgi:hypothetical protein
MKSVLAIQSTPMKLDILAFGAHPDDVELGCGGSMAKAVAQGKKVGIIDLTQGEMGTRGNPELQGKRISRLLQTFLGVSFQRKLSILKTLLFFNDSESHQMEGHTLSLRKYTSRCGFVQCCQETAIPIMPRPLIWFVTLAF